MCTQFSREAAILPPMPQMHTAHNKVGTRELRANLATALRRAAAGERVIVTESGRPVAQLGPVDAPAGTTMDELVARGLVVPPRRAPRDPDTVTPTPIDIHSGMRFDQIVRDLR
jgi:prevent-host-death family protein